GRLPGRAGGRGRGVGRGRGGRRRGRLPPSATAGGGRVVPRRLSSTLAPALAALALLASSPTRSRALPVRDPGPFWALQLAHQGARYADALPSGPSYRLVSGRLPAGLALEADGRIGGVPAETGGFELVLAAAEPSGASYPVRVALTV